MKVEFDEAVLKQVAAEVARIKAEYTGIVSDESIEALANEALQRLSGSHVTQYIPLFVGKFTRQSLKELLVTVPAASA